MLQVYTHPLLQAWWCWINIKDTSAWKLMNKASINVHICHSGSHLLEENHRFMENIPPFLLFLFFLCLHCLFSYCWSKVIWIIWIFFNHHYWWLKKINIFSNSLLVFSWCVVVWSLCALAARICKLFLIGPLPLHFIILSLKALIQNFWMPWESFYVF